MQFSAPPGIICKSGNSRSTARAIGESNGTASARPASSKFCEKLTPGAGGISSIFALGSVALVVCAVPSPWSPAESLCTWAFVPRPCARVAVMHVSCVAVQPLQSGLLLLAQHRSLQEPEPVPVGTGRRSARYGEERSMKASSPGWSLMQLFCVSAPTAAAIPYRPLNGLSQSANRWPRPRGCRPASLAPSGADGWAGPRLQPNVIRYGDRSPSGGRSQTTTGPTLPGTASAAAGSRRGGRRFFCCSVCAIEAWHKRSQSTAVGPLLCGRRDPHSGIAHTAGGPGPGWSACLAR